MKNKNHTPLTTAEMSSLWAQYINDSVGICVNTYFLEKVVDEDIRPVIEYSLKCAKNNLTLLEGIFKKESFPIPVGFTDQDVNPQAPRIFSDIFFIVYLQQMSVLAMASSSAAIGLATRLDVIDFHKRVLNEALKLRDQSRDVLMKKGAYIKPPIIPVPKKTDFVKKQHFLSGFIGKQRKATSIELTHLFLNLQTNAIGKAILMGFAQTAKDEEVKQYLIRGQQIAQKHATIFGNFLLNEEVPISISWDHAVLSSTESVFSDKLIMFHTSSMIAAGVGNYGTAISASLRRDFALQYASLIPEIILYSEDGANITIKHGWLEEPPSRN